LHHEGQFLAAASFTEKKSKAKGTQMEIQPYLFLEGRCEEAAEFYRSAVGAEVLMMMRYKDSPDPDQKQKCGGVDQNKIMHMSLRIGQSTLLLSDGMCKAPPKFEGFSLALTVLNEAEAKRVFATLSEGGAVKMPLAKTFFSPAFGMLTDRFGVMWMVLVK
jgi:PhnB protein